jgi:uncharacterized protein
MRVNTDEIKEGGLARSWDLTREQVDAIVSGDPAGYRAQGPAHLDAKLRKSGRRVLLEAKGEVALGAPCGRCLVPSTLTVPLQFGLTFVPADEYALPDGGGDDRGQGEVAGSFEPKQADEETFTGREVDLDPVVREQLLLALPTYPVCRDSCKGLCPVCGTNLNDKECGCDRKVPDPRWAGLEKFKKQQ